MRTRIRKLQKVGDSHYIALPPDWVKRHDLKKGNKLRIEYDESGTVKVSIIEEA